MIVDELAASTHEAITRAHSMDREARLEISLGDHKHQVINATIARNERSRNISDRLVEAAFMMNVHPIHIKVSACSTIVAGGAGTLLERSA